MFEHYILKAWEQEGEIREVPYQREIKHIFDPKKGPVEEFIVNMTLIAPYSGTQYHKHVISELIYVVSGRGELLLGQEKYALEPDIVFYVPKNVFHHIVNKGTETLKLFNVFGPGMDREEQKKKTVVAAPPLK